MRKFLLSIIFLIFLLNQAFGQDQGYARAILQDLCSPQFYGRAYSLKGDKKATEYITQKIKALEFNPQLQYFPITVNCFEGNAEIAIKKHTLKAGKDFLVSPTSKSFYGQRKTINFNPNKKNSIKKINKILSKKDSSYSIIFDTLNASTEIKNKYIPKINNHNRNYSKLEIITTPKITFQGIASKQDNYTTVKIANKLSKKNKINIKLDAELKQSYQSQNIITKIEGQIPDTFIIISAHYDHIGTLGKNTYFPGAHDNGSGTAMLLDLIRHFSQQNIKPYYSIVFINFSGEEVGLVGSEYYVRHPIIPLNKTKFLLNLDMLGSGDDGIMAVNGSIYNKEYQLFVKINQEYQLLKKIDKRGAAANSDHYFFYKKNIPCLFFYTMGQYKEYHNINDKAENLPMPVYDNIFKLITEFIKIYR